MGHEISSIIKETILVLFGFRVDKVRMDYPVIPTTEVIYLRVAPQTAKNISDIQTLSKKVMIINFSVECTRTFRVCKVLSC